MLPTSNHPPPRASIRKEAQRHRRGGGGGAGEEEMVSCFTAHAHSHRGHGATAARLTPDQKVGSSNLSGLILRWPICLVAGNEKLQC